MQTNYLKYFVDIADLGSISLAASKNFITSQGMSRSLSVLETELGCKLFDRTSNRIELNEYGSAVLPLAKQMLKLQDEMADCLSDIAKREASVLEEDVVALLNNVAFDASFFGPLTSSFDESFGHARYYQCDNEQVVERLIEESDEEGIHLGLLCLFSPDEERNAALVDRLKDAGFIYQPYLHSFDQVLVSAKSPLARKSALTRADILSRPIVSPGGDVGRAIELVFGKKSVSMTTGDSAFRQKVVADNGGIAFVPAFQQIFRKDDADDGCVIVPMKDPYYFEIGLVGEPGVFANPHVKKFFSRLNSVYLPYADTPYLALISSDLTLMRSDGVLDLPVANAIATMEDRYSISPRERDVFELLAAGQTAVPIAEKLFLSVSTVKSHIYSIYKKMGIHSQNELIEMLGSER